MRWAKNALLRRVSASKTNPNILPNGYVSLSPLLYNLDHREEWKLTNPNFPIMWVTAGLTITQNMLLTNQPDHLVRVAIIDSGIDPTHQKIGAVREVLLDSVPRQDTPIAGHGTACAGIVRQIAPTVDLYDIRIFDESLTADPPALLAAIRWTIDHQMDVVNLSLGTTDVTFRDALADLCRQARDAGVILVAAEHNDGRESYPAVLPDVIGVTGGRVRGRYGYYYRLGDAIECVAVVMTSASVGPIRRTG